MAINIEEDIQFIKEDLLPEMVFDRYFCEVGSREFVEFCSASVDYNPKKVTVPFDGLVYCIYSAEIIIEFSGVPTKFSIVIKLIPKAIECSTAFKYFLMEEYFYKNMVNKFKKNLFPKCYLTDSSKYRRPVIVLEDLLKQGFHNIDRNLNSEELKFCLNDIGQFHGEVFKLQEERDAIFRQFSINLCYAELSKEVKSNFDKKILRELKKKIINFNEFETKIGNCPIENLQIYNCEQKNKFYTVCHGNLRQPNLYFKFENDTIVEIKIDNFVFMKKSSIGFHITNFLLQNSDLLKTNFFGIDEYITAYLKGLNKVYYKISHDDLKNEMKDAFVFCHVNLSLNDMSDCAN